MQTGRTNQQGKSRNYFKFHDLSHYRFSTFLFGMHMDYRSSVINQIIQSKKIKPDREKKMDALRLTYKFLIMQNAVLKYILEQIYDTLIYVTIYDKFISPNLLRRYPQYAIVSLVRSCIALTY